MAQKTAIIIGAGYSGMALVNLLGKAGYKVDVFEKNSSAGGRISVKNQDGFLFDLGPSWYLMPEVFEQYYRLLGESSRKRLDLIRLDPGYKVFFEDGRQATVRGDVEIDAAVFENIERGAGDKLKRYVKRSTETYELAVKSFLYNNRWNLSDFMKLEILSRSPRMLQMLARTLDQHVRSNFKDKRLQQILEYHSVFLGSSPFEAPAIYSLMSHLDFKSGIFYPRRGMPSLVDDQLDISKKFDIEYHYGSPVRQINTDGDIASGVTLVDGSAHEAEVVISSADLHFTETQLVPESKRSYPQSYWKKRQAGPGAFLISIGIKGELPQLNHHNLYFVDDWKGNFKDIYKTKRIPDSASLYVCNPSKTDTSLAPDGYENLFVLMPIPSGVNLSPEQQERLYSKTINILAESMEIPDLSSRIVTRNLFGPQDFQDQFNAWQYNAFGGESHLLRQSVIFRTPNKSKKLKNLFYVGAGTVPGIGLPMCLISAQLTYKQIAGIDRSGPLEVEDLK